MADVEQNVDIFFVFKVSVEATNILVGQAAVNLNLTRQLLSCLRPLEVLLGNHFEGPGEVLVFFSLDRRNSFYFICLSKTTLSNNCEFGVVTYFSEEAAARIANSGPFFFWVFIRLLTTGCLLFLFNYLRLKSV